MPWNQFSVDCITVQDRLRLAIKHHTRAHAFDWERFDSYKAQALGELARRCVAESDLADARVDLGRLADIVDVLNDLGNDCPAPLKPFQTVRS